MLESEQRGARVFVDEFKARHQEQRGRKGEDTSEVIGRLVVAFDRLQWGFMKHDGQVLQGAASNYGILMRKLHANVGKSSSRPPFLDDTQLLSNTAHHLLIRHFHYLKRSH